MFTTTTTTTRDRGDRYGPMEWAQSRRTIVAVEREVSGEKQRAPADIIISGIALVSLVHARKTC